ncbi:phage tail protein [Dyella mobilis]|uniref:Phage tail protein n=1 Tax=Dyella mobilis TaxID=1849582 RepID=A0ABS2KDH2_9GAMM|nr:tail fiber protein [Dyella mobilis]MBM7128938.1 phage tail protein [Dyella mobilis]GLQ99372.1 tail Collar domain-containing protein [Dyella mobilis]
MSDPFLGEIRMVGFNFAPTGWALCAGNLMSISQNTALFSLLGTFYGGNGTTNFALPDLQGRSPVGTGNGVGLSPITIGDKAGVEMTTLTINQMPSHTHAVQSGGTVNVTGSVAVPACSSPTSGTVGGTPANNTVLGTLTSGGRAGELYTTTAANTTLLPFNVQSTGTAPAVTLANTGGNLPVAIRNPYLGLTCIIALQGIFPSRG